MKLVNEIFAEAGMNTRVPHLEGKRVFGLAKQKLDLPPGDESDFHRHNRVNYSIPKLEKGLLLTQNRGALQFKSEKPIQSSIDLETSNSSFLAKVVCTRAGLPILETPCSNPMGWRIEHISSGASNICRGHTANGSKCNAKIAKYCKVVASLPLLEFKELRSPRKHSKCSSGFALGSSKLGLWELVLNQLCIILLFLLFGL